MRSKPPRLATALLERIGPQDEALIGDLVEAYCLGRSRAWYWRQVLAAILIGAATEVRAHKLLAVRAVAVGWIAGWAYFGYAGGWVYSALYSAANFDEYLFVTGLTKWFYRHHVGFPDVFMAWAGHRCPSQGSWNCGGGSLTSFL